MQRAGLDFSTYIADCTHDFTGRVWVFAEIDRWLADADAPHYFIITGEPGIGKTAIAARLTQICKLAAIHFCIGGRGSTTEPLSFIQSIAEQLSDSLPSFGQALIEAQQAFADRNVIITTTQEISSVHGGQVIGVSIQHLEIQGLSPEAAFDRLVRRPLQALDERKNLPQVIILVDALHEAVAHASRPHIVEILTQTQDLPAQVRFILTSRSASDAVSSFADGPHITIEAASPENQEDVARYLGHILQRDEGLRKALVNARWDEVQFVSNIGRISEWNFLYLNLVLPEIAEGRLGPGKTVEELSSDNVSVREKAAQDLATWQNLATLKDRSIVPILVYRLGAEPSPIVRYWLAYALGKIGGEKACAALQEAFEQETDVWAKQGIAEGLRIAGCRPEEGR